MSRNISTTTESREEKSYVKDILKILFRARIGAASRRLKVTFNFSSKEI